MVYFDVNLNMKSVFVAQCSALVFELGYSIMNFSLISYKEK